MNVKGKKVFVGLSGGVDSAVSAALLKEQGADVVGVFIKGWYPPELPCTWAEDRRDAMRVAAHLGIPFHTLDSSQEYKQSVIDYLIREYAAGRTPNPDIMCNRDVKFGVFYEFARAHGADFIATGHYARVEHGPNAECAAPRSIHCEVVRSRGYSVPLPHTQRLLRGVDPEKDQSYFLWAISPEALAMTLFPLGGMHKGEVRELAKRFKLPNAEKRDSQGICFLGPVSMDDFLRAELPHESGGAVDEAGAEVGTHDGVLLHTLGERVALAGADTGPWYVVRKDIPRNLLVVSNNRAVPTNPTSLSLTDTNWFSTPSASLIEAQLRYHGPRISGVMRGSQFTPENPIEEPVASGQSLVIYSGEEVLGGGILQ